MDSTLSPYRIAWQRPDSVNVRSASRAAVLDALDTRSSLSRGQLQAMTGLSPLTLRRACRQLVRENVVVLQYGKNSDTGHACDLFSRRWCRTRLCFIVGIGYGLRRAHRRQDNFGSRL